MSSPKKKVATPALEQVCRFGLLLDIKKAADFLGVRPWTLRELAWAKRIPSQKLGNGRTSKIYFRPEDLRQFVEDQFTLPPAKRTGRVA